MRVIILGAGTAGRHLGANLCEAKHDVVMVDHDLEALEETERQLDALTVEGDGSSPAVLEKAGISKANVLAGVTNRNETNILACIYARSLGVKHTIARVTNPDHTLKDCGVDLKALGVDLTVNDKQECVREIANILRLPGTTEVIDLFDGALKVIGVRVPSVTPLYRQPIGELSESRNLKTLRFIAIRRGNKIIVPRGDTHFLMGDEVYVSIRPADIPDFLAWAVPEISPCSKLVISSGSELGLLLAQTLEKSDMRVVLLESNVERARHCAENLKHALVLRGMALDQETLEEAGVRPGTAFVAASESDENNMISCIMATKLGTDYTLAQIRNPDYMSVITSLGVLDRAVLPQHSLISAILQFVRGKNVRHAAVFHDMPGELVEVEVEAGDDYSSQKVSDLRIRRKSILVGVMREGKVEIPTGELVLLPGDRVVLFSMK